MDTGYILLQSQTRLCENSFMRIGAFDINEKFLGNKEVDAVALLYPWVDAGSVATLALETLEEYLGADEIGELRRPGSFFDFTRYRPEATFLDGERRIYLPNSKVYYASREDGPDILFLHLKEPHAQHEMYIKSVMDLLRAFKVKRYCRISGMYNAVPHTRPLRVTGSPGLENTPGLESLVSPRVGSSYQGPTSIMSFITDELDKDGIESVNFMVHLPHYLGLGEDYSGAARLVEILCKLYNIPSDIADFEEGKKQYESMETELYSSPQARSLVEGLEEYYDSQSETDAEDSEESTQLSPDVESFLEEIGKQLDEDRP